MSTTTTRADAAMAQFQADTSRWGAVTMALGLVASLIGPTYLVFFSGLGVSVGDVLTAFAAVAATFGVFWLLEPVTYFPILGSAAMYQAFMIGNISNKLLPSAVVAQASVGATPGTRRGDFAAVMAICGAATVHLTSLLIFVGVLGTWLLNTVPAEVIDVARSYILPSLMGAVLVQTVWTLKRLRPTLIAIGVALVLQFAVVPFWATIALYSVAVCVLLTVALSWALRDRSDTPATTSEGTL